MQLRQAMRARDPSEDHRTATPLELFFDLTFVVAVAQAAAGLHHGLVDGHASDVLLTYPAVFFAIWWAWMNFTWFASAYDTDDAIYRIAVLVQMAGVLVLAAGVPRIMEDGDFGVGVAGYVIMRLALVAQWLRAAAAHPEGRTCALRYAVGITACQLMWIARLTLDGNAGIVSFVVLVAAELAVPIWAERAGRTTWHPGHIAERYGLFTIIVLGESVLSATVGVQVALDGDVPLTDLLTVIVGGLLIVFSMWWHYFDLPAERLVERVRETFEEHLSAPFLWGYGHYFVFGAAAAVGAGLAVAVDQVQHHSVLTDTQAGLTVTVSAVVYLVALWALHHPYKRPGVARDVAPPVAVVLILASSFTSEPVLLTGVVLASLVVISVVSYSQPATR